MSKVSMADIQHMRAVREFHLARLAVNPQRQFMKAKGLHGKQKKLFRKALRQRQKEKLASAQFALETDSQDLMKGARKLG